MKPSEVLRRAAKRVEEGRTEFGCHAIRSIVVYESLLTNWRDATVCPLYKEAMKYYRQLKSRSLTDHAVWFHLGNSKDPTGRRVLALCFAAAIAESEGE